MTSGQIDPVSIFVLDQKIWDVEISTECVEEKFNNLKRWKNQKQTVKNGVKNVETKSVFFSRLMGRQHKG